MISTVERHGHKLKVSTRALMALEERFDMPVSDLFAQLGGGLSIRVVVAVLAEILNDGAGVPEKDAVALVDELGLPAVAEVISAAAEKAFGEVVEKNA